MTISFSEFMFTFVVGAALFLLMLLFFRGEGGGEKREANEEHKIVEKLLNITFQKIKEHHFKSQIFI